MSGSKRPLPVSTARANQPASADSNSRSSKARSQDSPPQARTKKHAPSSVKERSGHASPQNSAKPSPCGQNSDHSPLTTLCSAAAKMSPTARRASILRGVPPSCKHAAAWALARDAFAARLPNSCLDGMQSQCVLLSFLPLSQTLLIGKLMPTPIFQSRNKETNYELVRRTARNDHLL